jgi:hypothetical protein
MGLVITVSALAPILTMTVHHAKLRRLDAEIGLAFAAVSSNLEEVRSLPLVSLPGLHGAGFDVPGPSGAPGGLSAQPGDADGMPGSFTVLVEATQSGQTLYRVRAAVAWQGSMGRQEMHFETFVSNRGS